MAQEFIALNSPEHKVRRAIELLVAPMSQDDRIPHIDEGTLQRIVVAEYPKIYLTKEVDNENEEGYFQGYNRICDILTVAALQINPKYKFPHSLFSTVISAAQSQQFFVEHLPRLSDARSGRTDIIDFLTELTLKTISKDE